MRIPDAKIEEIASKIDIGEVVGQHLTLTRKGTKLWGLCPFHQEKTPSFSVTPEKGMFYCFGCHKGGSVFTFLMEVEKLSFLEAVQQLAGKAGVALDLDEPGPGVARRDALQDLLKRVAGSFFYIFTNSAAAAGAREYLSRRGIDSSSIEKFSLGYSPTDRGWLHRFLREKNYSEEILAASGMFSTRYPTRSFFSGRLMFPIYSYRGHVIAFGGRSLVESGPKYLNSPESLLFHKGENLYGLYQGLEEIRGTRSFFLVEGYIDVIAMHQAGLTNTVAPLGTAFTESQARLLKRYAEHAFLVFDGDSAGIKATRRALEICEKAGIPAEVIELPQGLDPADILEKQSAEALKNVLKYRINNFEYLLNSVISRCDPATPEGKEFVINDLFPYIECVDSEVRREAYLDAIARTLNVERQSVLHDFSRRRGKPDPGHEPRLEKKNEGTSIDLFLMLAVTAHREYFPFVRTMLTPEDLEDHRAREVYIALEECFRNGEDSVELLTGKIDSPEVRISIFETLNSEEFSINSDRIIRDTVYRIRQRSLDRKRVAVISRLRRSANQKDGQQEDIKELLLEKMYLDGELEKLKVNGNDRDTD